MIARPHIHFSFLGGMHIHRVAGRMERSAILGPHSTFDTSCELFDLEPRIVVFVQGQGSHHPAALPKIIFWKDYSKEITALISETFLATTPRSVGQHTKYGRISAIAGVISGEWSRHGNHTWDFGLEEGPDKMRASFSTRACRAELCRIAIVVGLRYCPIRVSISYSAQ